MTMLSVVVLRSGYETLLCHLFLHHLVVMYQIVVVEHKDLLEGMNHCHHVLDEEASVYHRRQQCSYFDDCGHQLSVDGELSSRTSLASWCCTLLFLGLESHLSLSRDLFFLAIVVDVLSCLMPLVTATLFG